MNLRSIRLRVWRAVEAQHRVSTLRLTGNDPVEHEALEGILEESKPPAPESAARLHYLLATPFRYPSPHGSRFRGPSDPGVFYGARERRTACAEAGYWRWRFVRESDGLRELNATPQTLFRVGVEGTGVDLSSRPYVKDRVRWSHPSDYRPTQELGRAARGAGAEVVLYESVRDPQAGECAAVLHPGVFRPQRPLAQETWYLTVAREAALWSRERAQFVFEFR